MILSTLADVCRRSGLHVVEVPGWRTRGHGQFESIESITCHHTATPASIAGNYPTLGVVRDGRPGLDGPLAQLGLGRDSTVYVIAAGVAWHAGATFYEWQNNWHAIGIEAEHPGGNYPWNLGMYRAYVRLCRALADGYDVPYARVVGHKEIAKPLGRKTDPTFDMAPFRRAVATIYSTPPGGDMDLNDVIPGLEDRDGRPVTVGQALARAVWTYDQVREGGTTDKRLDQIEQEG